MGKFEDLFNESDDAWIARSKKNITNLPKTKNTRTAGEKAEYEAGRAESRKWAEQRAAAQEESAKRMVEGMSPGEKQSMRDRYKVTNPHN
jgi:hypothetical protein